MDEQITVGLRRLGPPYYVKDDRMENSHLSVIVGGAFFHPLGDSQPIDLRYNELIATEDLPARQLLAIDQQTELRSPLPNPRAVVIENNAGVGLQTQPTDEEAAAIARKVLRVGVWDLNVDGGHPILLRPAKLNTNKGQGQFLWLGPGSVVSVRPADPTGVIPIRVVWFPGANS